MTTSHFPGHLSKELLLKIFQKIASPSDYGWFKNHYRSYLGGKPLRLEQEVLALAFASFVASEFESVTSHHLKMLKKELSEEQVKELFAFILSVLERQQGYYAKCQKWWFEMENMQTSPTFA